MALDEWSETLPGLVRGPLLVYKNRRNIYGLWKRLQAYMDIGGTNIAVLGKSGVGKSVLTSHLHGEANSLDWAPPGVSSNIETSPISIGEWTRLVRVIPGQSSSERAKGLTEVFHHSSSLEGVIYVCAGGYIKIRDSSVANDLIREMRVSSLDKYAAFQRQQEAADLREVCNRLLETQASGKKPRFLVVAVNKCDLFLDRLASFYDFYGLGGSGPTAKVLRDFKKESNNQELRVSVVPVSAYPEDFEWNGTNITTQITTVTQHKNLVRNFLTQLAEGIA